MSDGKNKFVLKNFLTKKNIIILISVLVLIFIVSFFFRSTDFNYDKVSVESILEKYKENGKISNIWEAENDIKFDFDIFFDGNEIKAKGDIKGDIGVKMNIPQEAFHLNTNQDIDFYFKNNLGDEIDIKDFNLSGYVTIVDEKAYFRLNFDLDKYLDIFVSNEMQKAFIKSFAEILLNKDLFIGTDFVEDGLSQNPYYKNQKGLFDLATYNESYDLLKELYKEGFYDIEKTGKVDYINGQKTAQFKIVLKDLERIILYIDKAINNESFDVEISDEEVEKFKEEFEKVKTAWNKSGDFEYLIWVSENSEVIKEELMIDFDLAKFIKNYEKETDLEEGTKGYLKIKTSSIYKSDEKELKLEKPEKAEDLEKIFQDFFMPMTNPQLQ